MGKNNDVELHALKFLLKLAADKGIPKMEVYEDFEMIQKCIKGSYKTRTWNCSQFCNNSSSWNIFYLAYHSFTLIGKLNIYVDEL